MVSVINEPQERTGVMHTWSASRLMFARPSVISSAPENPSPGNRRRLKVSSKFDSPIAWMNWRTNGSAESKLKWGITT